MGNIVEHNIRILFHAISITFLAIEYVYCLKCDKIFSFYGCNSPIFGGIIHQPNYSNKLPTQYNHYSYEHFCRLCSLD